MDAYVRLTSLIKFLQCDPRIVALCQTFFIGNYFVRVFRGIVLYSCAFDDVWMWVIRLIEGVVSCTRTIEPAFPPTLHQRSEVVHHLQQTKRECRQSTRHFIHFDNAREIWSGYDAATPSLCQTVHHFRFCRTHALSFEASLSYVFWAPTTVRSYFRAPRVV